MSVKTAVPIVNPMSCIDRVILVTGASGGIGRASAILLSKLGAQVILTSRNREKLEETLALMYGDRHRIVSCDLSDTEAIPGWLKGITAETGPLHGLVHSAGLQHYLPIRFINTAKVEQLLRINVVSGAMLAKGCAMKGGMHHGGSIVFISSVTGMVGDAGLSAYAASKGALIAMTRSLALEFAKAKIRVNAVVPGCVETKMLDRMRQDLTSDQFQALTDKHPLGLGNPEDVANAVAFLLAETGRWITGSALMVDGGYTSH